MTLNKENVLTGAGNKRLNNTDAVHSENTAAWTDTEKVIGEAKVSVPSSTNTINAKEWVDDGSKL